MNPNELKKQISQMEQERTQLMQKINIFKNKNTDKPPNAALPGSMPKFEKKKGFKNRL